MRLLPSDPDIQTLVGRINSGDIDLQPDFQRGEVWGPAKQRRLIDSILRDWHVPPIHLIQHSATKKQEVLDGQQRLVAIRDFVHGRFRIDGMIEPVSKEIMRLHGLTYDQLPPDWKRQFDQFTIRVFRIVDFSPDEPAELFYRLNQPVALTSAEQRNAFFGPVRSQVKEIVGAFDALSFGFSNSRMALDDVVARICLSIENGSILEKVTAVKLTQRYRECRPFAPELHSVCERAVKCFASSAELWREKQSLNKATLFSWLWASACLVRHYNKDIASALLAHAINLYDALRKREDGLRFNGLSLPSGIELSLEEVDKLLWLFSDRSSSRVSDVSSVIARDLVIWILLCNGVERLDVGDNPYSDKLTHMIRRYRQGDEDAAQVVMQLIESKAWGAIL